MLILADVGGRSAEAAVRSPLPGWLPAAQTRASGPTWAGTGWDCYVDSGRRGWKVRAGGCSRSKPLPGWRPAAQTRASPPHQAKNGLDGDPGVWAYVGG